jgi:hypothetical protein
VIAQENFSNAPVSKSADGRCVVQPADLELECFGEAAVWKMLADSGHFIFLKEGAAGTGVGGAEVAQLLSYAAIRPRS